MALGNRGYKKCPIIRKRCDFNSSQGDTRDFKDQYRRNSFWSVACDRDKRKQRK